MLVSLFKSFQPAFTVGPPGVVSGLRQPWVYLCSDISSSHSRHKKHLAPAARFSSPRAGTGPQDPFRPFGKALDQVHRPLSVNKRI